MQTIDEREIVELADRVHSLQRDYRDQQAKLAKLAAEIEPLHNSLLKYTSGTDFCYASADGYLKTVEFMIDGSPDIEAMSKRLTALRYKVPVKQTLVAVVSWATSETDPEPIDSEDEE